MSCLIGCVTTQEGGNPNPLATEKGKKEAIQAYVDLAMGYVKSGNTEQAKEPLIDALKINPSDVDANAALAYVFQVEGESTHAEQYFKKALSGAPKDARILNNYGVFLFGQKRYADAKVQFLAASEDAFYSERSMVLENIGLVSIQQNNLKEAEDYFQRALRLNSNRISSIYELAKLYYAQGDYPTAQRYYNAILSRTDGRQGPEGLLLGINISNKLNDKTKAANYASQLEQLYPDSAEYKQYKAGKK